MQIQTKRIRPLFFWLFIIFFLHPGSSNIELPTEHSPLVTVLILLFIFSAILFQIKESITIHNDELIIEFNKEIVEIKINSILDISTTPDDLYINTKEIKIVLKDIRFHRKKLNKLIESIMLNK